MCAPIAASTASVVSSSSIAATLLANKLIALAAILGIIGFKLLNVLRHRITSVTAC